MTTPIITIDTLIIAINNREIDDLKLRAKFNGIKPKPIKKAVI